MLLAIDWVKLGVGNAACHSVREIFGRMIILVHPKICSHTEEGPNAPFSVMRHCFCSIKGGVCTIVILELPYFMQSRPHQMFQNSVKCGLLTVFLLNQNM